MRINLYTDGACKGNPGPGGYGIVLEFKGKKKEINCGYRLTTNNRMELMALIVGLESIKKNQYPVHVFSDSKYVIDSISKGWVFNWKTKGFKGEYVDMPDTNHFDLVLHLNRLESPLVQKLLKLLDLPG